jgi:hypothetical protein
MKYALLALLLTLRLLHANAADNFSTAIKSNLMVSGEACTNATNILGRLNFAWTEFTCRPGEYLLLIGDETDSPVIGKLEKSTLNTNDEFEYYKIIPTIPVDAKKRWILRSHQLRVSLSGEAHVVKVR